jgi:hypothetical protein
MYERNTEAFAGVWIGVFVTSFGWVLRQQRASEPGVKDSVGGTRYTGKKRTIVMTVILVWDEHGIPFLNLNRMSIKNLEMHPLNSELKVKIVSRDFSNF